MERNKKSTLSIQMTYGDTMNIHQVTLILKRDIKPKTRYVLSRLFRIVKPKQTNVKSEAFQAALSLQWTRELWQDKLYGSIKWFGVPILQWPTDLQLLQELVYKLKPQFIIETGTYNGGSAIFFASLLKMFDIEGKVISVDNKLQKHIKHTVADHPLGESIILLEGNSVSAEMINNIKQIVGNEENVLVFLDSDHSYKHVLKEMRLYQQFVSIDGYMCAFDTICKDLYDLPSGQPKWKHDNPHRALMDFLKENDCFEIDKHMNRLLVGFAPDGFLKRTR